MDAPFLNDDRHSNNIAVLECDGKYDYCPIFDNGAGLLSNIRIVSMDIEPKAPIVAQRARPFGMTFNRQAGAVRVLYGREISMHRLSSEAIFAKLEPLRRNYPQRDRGRITNSVCTAILLRQR